MAENLPKKKYQTSTEERKMKFEKREESVVEFIQRLRKKFRTPEFRAKKRDENVIREWKHGKTKRTKTSNGSTEFKLPKNSKTSDFREEWEANKKEQVEEERKVINER